MDWLCETSGVASAGPGSFCRQTKVAHRKRAGSRGAAAPDLFPAVRLSNGSGGPHSPVRAVRASTVPYLASCPWRSGNTGLFASRGRRHVERVGLSEAKAELDLRRSRWIVNLCSSSSRVPLLSLRLRGKDSNLDYLIQSQASYH